MKGHLESACGQQRLKPLRGRVSREAFSPYPLIQQTLRDE